MVSKRDTNHNLIPDVMKHRMGGYYKDENGVHYAHMQGLLVTAYDMHKAGLGMPDWKRWADAVNDYTNPGGTNDSKAKAEPKKKTIKASAGAKRGGRNNTKDATKAKKRVSPTRKR